MNNSRNRQHESQELSIFDIYGRELQAGLFFEKEEYVNLSISKMDDASDFTTGDAYIAGESWFGSVAFGDVDGNGDVELVATTMYRFGDEFDSSVFIFHPDENGLGTPVRVAYDESSDANGLEVVDLDQDGASEIIIVHSLGLTIISSDGTGGYDKQLVSSSETGTLVSLDVNRDGNKDILGVPHSDPVNQYFGDGTKNISSISPLSTNNAGFNDLAIGDLNNDGFDDLVVMSGQDYATPNISVHLHDQISSLLTPETYTVGESEITHGIAVGDINNDGRDDIVLTRARNSPTHLWYYIQDESGNLIGPSQVESYDIPETIRMADLNHDGFDDVVVLHGGWQRMGVYLAGPEGLGDEILIGLPYVSHYDPEALAFGDMNKDGCPEMIAIASYHEGVIPITHTLCPFLVPEGGLLEVENSTYSVAENGISLDITINRVDGDKGTVSVDVTTLNATATSSEDYQAYTQTLTFLDGESSKTITIDVNDDFVYEGDETFNVSLSNVQGFAVIGGADGVSLATVTIIENEAPQFGTIDFEASNFSVNEGDGFIDITLRRVSGSDTEVGVDVVTSDGTAIANDDYQSLSRTLTFADGETSKSLRVFINNDLDYTGDRTFNLTLSEPTGGVTIGTPTVEVNIIDDDPIPYGVLEFGSSTYSTNENVGTFNMTVTRTEGSYGEVTVDLGIAGGSAVNGEDYQFESVVLTFAVGETTKLISVTILDNEIYEINQTIELRLSNVQGGASIGVSSTTITIVEDDATPPSGALQFNNSIYRVKEDAGIFSIIIERTGGGFGEVSVDYTVQDKTAHNSSDFTLINGTVDFSDGELSKTININIVDDDESEGVEKFKIALSNPLSATLGSMSTAIIYIEDDDGGLPIIVVTENASGSGSLGIWFLMVITVGSVRLRKIADQSFAVN